MPHNICKNCSHAITSTGHKKEVKNIDGQVMCGNTWNGKYCGCTKPEPAEYQGWYNKAKEDARYI